MTDMEVTKKVLAGYRMSQPKKCPDAVYRLMRGCCNENPANRSNFEFLFQYLCMLKDNSANSDDDEHIYEEIS